MNKLEVATAPITKLIPEYIRLSKQSATTKYLKSRKNETLEVFALPDYDKILGNIIIDIEKYNANPNQPITIAYQQANKLITTTLAQIYLNEESNICRIEIIKPRKTIVIDNKYIKKNGHLFDETSSKTSATLSDIKNELSARRKLTHIEFKSGILNISKGTNIDLQRGSWYTSIHLNLYSNPYKVKKKLQIYKIELISIAFDAYHNAKLDINHA